MNVPGVKIGEKLKPNEYLDDCNQIMEQFYTDERKIRPLELSKTLPFDSYDIEIEPNNP